MEEQLKQKGQSVALKVVVIGFMIVGLLVPVLLIMALISERESSKATAVSEVSAMWGNAQTIGALVLAIPYTTTSKDEEGKVRESQHHMHVLPKRLHMRTNVMPIIRKRSIYNVILYSASSGMEGEFELPKHDAFPENTSAINWDKSSLNIGITDTRGIGNEVQVNWDGKTLNAEPGTRCVKVIPAGVSAAVNLSESDVPTGHTFRIHWIVRGSGELRFIPSGKTTTVEVKSGWDTPSYTGAYLPKTHSANSKGFAAEWEVSEFSRGLPATWIGSGPDMNQYSFGVELLEPVDIYRMTTRSVKYAVLFITLTFVAFFMMEVLTDTRLHPVHYLLVGFAVTLFYLLLVALSEQFAFVYSYIAASASTILLIGFYVKGVARSWKPAATILTVLTALYSLLYILLQLEDYALLVGSVVLFLLLASIMALTRRIDWWQPKRIDTVQSQSEKK